MKTFNSLYRGVDRANEKEQALVGGEEQISIGKTASFGGITWKTFLLVALMVVTGIIVSVLGISKATITVERVGEVDTLNFKPGLWVVLGVSGIIAFICVIIGSFFPKSTIVTGPLYAVAQGALVGTIATIIHFFLPVVGLIAIGSTLAIFLITLLFNIFAPFRAKKFAIKAMITIGISLLIASLIFLIIKLAKPSLFDPNYSGGLSSKAILAIGIIFSIFFIIFGGLMLSSQFTYAEQLVANGSRKIYEWSVAFGILYALVIIYMEIIRLLLSIIASRNN